MSRIVLLLVALAVPSALAAQPAVRATPRADFILEMNGAFRKADTDKNGQLNRAEIERVQKAEMQARSRVVFTRLDTDKNGQLSQAEFAKAAEAAPVNAAPMLNRMDSNRDQQISLKEYSTGALANFDKLDADKDGIVSPAEIKAALGR